MWWRKVRSHIHWKPGAPLPPEGDSYFIHDVKRRPQDEGLSIYRATALAEVERIAHYYALTLSGYDHVDYVVIPDAVWTSLNLKPEHFSYDDLVPFLAGRHFEVRKLTAELESQVAALTIGDQTRLAGRAKKKDILLSAPGYLAADVMLRQFLHEEWVTRLLPPTSSSAARQE